MRLAGHEMALVWLISGLCIALTIALLYYSTVLLPRRIEDRIRQSIRAFSTAVELRFPSHKGLSERVCMLCVLVAKRMNLTAQQVRDIEMAAELRDIGLCAIPYGLVNKKSTYHWDEADWATYYRHAEVSGAMLELVPSLRHLAPIVRWHHTDFFGPEVFPSGHDIPIESRILKVVSEYVWLTKLQGSLLAKDALKRERGRAFDPAVVDNLLQVLTSTSVESSRTTVQV